MGCDMQGCEHGSRGTGFDYGAGCWLLGAGKTGPPSCCKTSMLPAATAAQTYPSSSQHFAACSQRLSRPPRRRTPAQADDGSGPARPQQRRHDVPVACRRPQARHAAAAVAGRRAKRRQQQRLPPSNTSSSSSRARPWRTSSRVRRCWRRCRPPAATASLRRWCAASQGRCCTARWWCTRCCMRWRCATRLRMSASAPAAWRARRRCWRSWRW